ncbi:hypothetical protein EV130_1206 [Rhizobium azibense]|uniref:Uncharacterized protein n=1 Tax=Rhizobium azibense TaxID=1136135 RepID=A0A4R3Q8E0_9HYPH|nr:hypothetical protein EV130_1206 [Rhizobium azibense]
MPAVTLSFPTIHYAIVLAQNANILRNKPCTGLVMLLPLCDDAGRRLFRPESGR